MRKISFERILLTTASIALLLNCSLLAVTSQVTRHSTAADFLKGKTENTVIDSRCTIQLARQASEIKCPRLLKNVWAINTIIADDTGTVYIGTSPNGKIFKYEQDKPELIYPAQENNSKSPYGEVQEVGQENPEGTQPETDFTNEHIFALAIDKADRLLAGVSGNNCRLLRFENNSVETIFTPDDDTYIFAVHIDEIGNIYLGTGPNGRIYRLDPFGKNPEQIYKARDRNILSLALDKDGYVYAGSDQRGIIYKINQNTKTATVLFDSEQDEITALFLDENQNLYAAAASAEAAKSKVTLSSIAQDSSTGRPDTENSSTESKEQNSDSVALKTANTSQTEEAPKTATPPEAQRGTFPKAAGHIYKINPAGFVTDVFAEMAVFFDMKSDDQNILLATGNNAQLFKINPETEQKTIAYEDQQSSQITALAIADDSLFLGCANPPKILKLSPSLAPSGHYISDLVDAAQPAYWGKLQVDADIPTGCKILLSARSGNVKDPNDPTFSSWTLPVQVTKATQLDCPNARFCQYKLTLENSTGNDTPVVREVSLAHVIPNLPPKILAVNTIRSKDKKKSNLVQINYKAVDDNKDTLIFKLQFRKLTRSTWIQLKDKLTAFKFDWDTNTIEDGRYELRVTASDERSNTTATAMSTSRISDSFVVDNTAPVIKNENIDIDNQTVIIKLTVEDVFTAIGNVSYTLNSNEDWTSTLPEDMVYDTVTEDFNIVLENVEQGKHVIALKISDDLGNTMYKTYDINID
jgi:hypothetical protein